MLDFYKIKWYTFNSALGEKNMRMKHVLDENSTYMGCASVPSLSRLIVHIIVYESDSVNNTGFAHDWNRKLE